MQKVEDLRFGTAVSIVWRDSASYNGWRGDTQGLKAGEVVTLGYVLRSDDQDLVLTTSIGDQGGGLDPLVIPWVAIDQVEKIEEYGL